jgi:peroxiredoxin
LLLADGNGEFTRALGLEEDRSASGLGVRSRRYAALLDDGVVSYLGVEPEHSALSVSSAEAVLAAL